MTPSFKKPGILIADDTPGDIRTLLSVLNELYEVYVATNGEDALSMAAGNPPDLILLDVLMPDINGFAVCRSLKAAPGTRDIPVLFISGLENPQDSLIAFDVGGVDFIRKPFNRDEVLSRVRVHLQLKNTQHQLQILNNDLEHRVEERTAELATALRMAESASRVKSSFQASVSHELRTPLNAILGFSEALASGAFGPLTERQLGYVNDIFTSGRHLHAMVNDLLDISVAESGHLQLSTEAVNLVEVTAEATHMLANRLASADVSLSVSCDHEEIVILGDRTRILQILLNVLGNAIKFNKPGGWVRITLQREEEHGCCLDVIDGGIGMTPEEVALALTPFGRSSNPVVAAVEGTGLGLPLAAAIIAAHDGELSVSALKDVGTSVHMTFPEKRLQAGTFSSKSGNL